MRALIVALALLAWCGCSSRRAVRILSAHRQPASSVTPIDYGADASWLCRPGRADACAVDLTTTVVRADGSVTREAWAADPNAPIDCFYVYPTVRPTRHPTATWSPTPPRSNVIHQQFARFGSKCRPYAPLYRQVTLAGLRRLIAGGGGGSAWPAACSTTTSAMRGITISSTTTGGAASCSSATRRAPSSSRS